MFLGKSTIIINLKNLFLLLFIISSSIISQVNPDVAFYPLHVGDTWQYLVDYKYRDPAQDSSYYATVTVKGIDTLYGKTYYTITNSENWSLKHLRIDSTDATVWELKGESESMIDSLAMEVGTRMSWVNSLNPKVCYADTITTIFDEEIRVKTFTPWATTGAETKIVYKYGYGLGEIYSITTSMFIEASSVNRTLVYAKIDEVEYGQFPQEELNLFPLQVGNKWIYLNSGYTYDPYDSMPNQTHFAYKLSFEITSDTVVDARKYYYCKDGQYGNYWLRTDSVTNSIYKRYDFTEDEECLLINLSAKTEEEFDICNGLQSNSFEADTLLWGENRFLKTFFIQSLSEYQSKFVEGIGKVKSKSSFDFGESTTLLLGCIINGVEYGDLYEDPLNYYPLEIGNKWVYEWSIDNGAQKYVTTSEIIDKEIKPNGLVYYKRFEENKYTYERIDSTSGIVYQFDEEADTSNSEFPVLALTAKIGDTLFTKDNIKVVYGGLYSEKIFGKEVCFIWYSRPQIRVYQNILAYGFGTSKIILGLNRETEKNLLGCVINGIAYGDTTVVSVDEEIEELPTVFSLSQNYPNPFNPSTTIRYSIPGIVGTLSEMPVQLKIYNTLGQEVAILVNKIERAGNYEVQFDASNLTSGIYFYKLQSGSFEVTKKLLFLK